MAIPSLADEVAGSIERPYAASTFDSTPLKVGYIKISKVQRPMHEYPFFMALEGRWVVSIDIDGRPRAALAMQMERMAAASDSDTALDRFAASVIAAIEQNLDPDLKAPTAAQLRLVMETARELNMPLPAEVLRFRGEAEAFIGIKATDEQDSLVSKLAIQDVGVKRTASPPCHHSSNAESGRYAWLTRVASRGCDDTPDGTLSQEGNIVRALLRRN